MGTRPSKETRSNRSEEAEPQRSPSDEQLKISVQCEDDPVPSDPLILVEENQYPMFIRLPLPVQCEDDPVPSHPVILVEENQYPMFIQLSSTDGPNDDGGPVYD